MTAIVKLSDFRKAVNDAARVAPSRTTMPIYGTILLESGEDTLTVTASNGAKTMARTIMAVGKLKTSISVDAKHLVRYVKTLADQEAELSVDAETLELTIKTRRGKARMKGFPGDEFPALPRTPDEGDGVLDAEDLLALFQRVVYAASTDESHPVLTAIHLYTRDGTLVAEAADGFRLARASIPYDGKDLDVLLPASAVTDLMRVMDSEQIRLCADDAHVTFADGQTVFISQLVFGSYPDIERIIPQGSKLTVSLDREELSDGLAQTLVFSPETKMVTLTPNGALEIEGQQVESGVAKAIVPAKITGDCFGIGINGAFLDDVLKAYEGTDALISAHGSTNPVRMTDPADPSWVAVIMPMHL